MNYVMGPKFCNVIITIFLCEFENCILTKRQAAHIKAAEMRFIRHVDTTKFMITKEVTKYNKNRVLQAQTVEQFQKSWKEHLYRWITPYNYYNINQRDKGMWRI